MKSQTTPLKKRFVQTGIILISVITMTDCASPGKKTAIGAGTGGATGAAVGAATGGWSGAAIGALAGAAVGGAFGNLLDHQANELKQVAHTERTPNGILVKLKSDLLFDTNSSALKEQAIQDLTQLGDILAKYPQDRIRVEGYTDNQGKETYNEALSKRRAQSVESVLVGRGTKTAQITILGQGESKPIADNKTATGRAANRRVELHIDMPEKATS